MSPRVIKIVLLGPGGDVTIAVATGFVGYVCAVVRVVVLAVGVLIVAVGVLLKGSICCGLASEL